MFSPLSGLPTVRVLIAAPWGNSAGTLSRSEKLRDATGTLSAAELLAVTPSLAVGLKEKGESWSITLFFFFAVGQGRGLTHARMLKRCGYFALLLPFFVVMHFDGALIACIA